jgi:hypothetical protein
MPSTWTRKVAAPIAAVATVALLVAGAGEAAASGDHLSVTTARHLAQKLANKQRQERSLRFTHLGRPHRRSSSRIDFDYRDRSTKDVLCNATIVVVQTSDSRSADMKDVACDGIPSEILSYEKVTRTMRNRARKALDDVRKSEDDYDKSLDPCQGLVVPKSRRDEVSLLYTIGATRASYAPLRGDLDDFNDALHDVHGQDPRMVRGVDAWDRTLVLFDEFPDATADPCKAVRKWAKNDYSSDSAPADFAELRVIRKQLRVQFKILGETAHHLAEEGAVPKVARAFDASLGLPRRIIPAS